MKWVANALRDQALVGAADDGDSGNQSPVEGAAAPAADNGSAAAAGSDTSTDGSGGEASGSESDSAPADAPPTAAPGGAAAPDADAAAAVAEGNGAPVVPAPVGPDASIPNREIESQEEKKVLNADGDFNTKMQAAMYDPATTIITFSDDEMFFFLGNRLDFLYAFRKKIYENGIGFALIYDPMELNMYKWENFTTAGTDDTEHQFYYEKPTGGARSFLKSFIAWVRSLYGVKPKEAAPREEMADQTAMAARASAIPSNLGAELEITGWKWSDILNGGGEGPAFHTKIAANPNSDVFYDQDGLKQGGNPSNSYQLHFPTDTEYPLGEAPLEVHVHPIFVATYKQNFYRDLIIEVEPKVP